METQRKEFFTEERRGVQVIIFGCQYRVQYDPENFPGVLDRLELVRMCQYPQGVFVDLNESPAGLITVVSVGDVGRMHVRLALTEVLQALNQAAENTEVRA